jgi:hypothetical protein
MKETIENITNSNNKHILKITQDVLLESKNIKSLLPIPHGIQVDNDGKLCLHMPGCGGMYPYAYGICGALQDNINLHSIRYATCSGSTPAVSTILFNAPAKPTLDLFERRKSSLLKKYGAKIYWPTEKFIHMAATHNNEIGEIFGNSEWNDWILTNHKVMVVCKPTNKRMYLDNFVSIYDYVSSCSASCSFPGIPTKYCSSKWKFGCKFGPFADGDSFGSYPSIDKFGPRLSIPIKDSKGLLNNNFLHKIYCVIMGLLGTNLSDYLYYEGYNDAIKFLIPSLLDLVPSAESCQSKSIGNSNQQAILKALPLDFTWDENINSVLFTSSKN